MAHLFGRDSRGRRVQLNIPEVSGLLRSLSDEALVEMFVKACGQIKHTDLSLPCALVVEVLLTDSHGATVASANSKDVRSFIC